MSLIEFFENTLAHKCVVILGFGREGKSTYRRLQPLRDQIRLIIADGNPELDTLFEQEFGQPVSVSLFGGNSYAQCLKEADVIIKSPGISYKVFEDLGSRAWITSQTELFLELHREKVIGITGTKGKSTTASLLHHIFQSAGLPVLFGGNIGIPPFDLLDQVKTDTRIVFEMSSHQLEHVSVSPHIAIILNIFQEHLDHYASYGHYQLAKYNIARWQHPDDYFLYNPHIPEIVGMLEQDPPKGQQLTLNRLQDQEAGVACEGDDLLIRFKAGEGVKRIKDLCVLQNLPGKHNLQNIMAACMAAKLSGVNDPSLIKALKSFKPLAHRLEYAGSIRGASFYNDSISTIPESTIAALKTFPNTQTLLLGGYDRGIDYNLLIGYLSDNPIRTLVFIGKAGKRMQELWLQQNEGRTGVEVLHFDDFSQAVECAVAHTREGEVCLLSPAASSYDMFRNFEERGEKFKQLIRAMA